MITTPVCQHGWPLYDVDPCPECLKVVERSVTAPVTGDDGDEFNTIPEVLRRVTGTVAGNQEAGAQTPVGDAPLPEGVASPPFSKPESEPEPESENDRGPGSVARRLGYPEHPSDTKAREALQALHAKPKRAPDHLPWDLVAQRRAQFEKDHGNS